MALGLSTAANAPAADRRALFDGHLHFSRDAWSLYDPAAIVSILDRAGIDRAIVSSTPDDGTLALHEHAPRRIVAFLRPYRTRADLSTWMEDPAILDYVERRLAPGIHRGIGEFHLFGDHAASPLVRRLVRLAVERTLYLHAHSDPEAVASLFEIDPKVRVIWAHAGMSVAPEHVRPLLDRFSALWVELSYRYDDIAPAGTLAPAWKALFVDYPERFILGTDTWTPTRWELVAPLADQARGWLHQLPETVANAIATGNAARLFGP